MNWGMIGLLWLAAGLLIAFALGEVMGPKADAQREKDDEAQLKALAEYNRKAQARQDALDKLKAKISGSEA